MCRQGTSELPAPLAGLRLIFIERSGHPLVQYAQTHDNMIITPHIGGGTVESIAGARIFIAEKLIDYIKQNF